MPDQSIVLEDCPENRSIIRQHQKQQNQQQYNNKIIQNNQMM